MNNKHAVHLYTQVRVKISPIEAATPKEALDKAVELVDFAELLNNHSPRGGVVGETDARIECVEHTEGAVEYALIDPIGADGDVIYEAARYVDDTGLELVNGMTPVERKAQCCDRAARFHSELVESVESLSGLVESHGQATLIDAVYLQAVMLDGGFVDILPESASRIIEVVQQLPSADEWMQFIRRVDG